MLPRRWIQLAMQEHVGDEGEALRHEERRDDGFIAKALTHQLGRDGGEGGQVLLVERNEPAGLEDQIDGDVEDDQRDRHILIVDAL